MNKSNDKGFTLVEVISVIAILLVLTTIAIPSVITYQNSFKEKNYKKIVTNINTAAESFIEVNRSDIPFNDEGIYYVKLQLLADTGNIKSPIINPKNNKEFDLDSWVKVIKKANGSIEYIYPAKDNNGNEFPKGINPNNPNIKDSDYKIDIKLEYNGTDVTNKKISVNSQVLPITKKTLKNFAKVTYTPNIIERYKRLLINPDTNITKSTKVTYTAVDLLTSNSKTVTLDIEVSTLVVDKILPNCKTNSSGLYEGEDCYFKGSDPNNYLWYSGYTWRIVGVNSDGSIKMITKNPVANLSWGANKKSYEQSYVRSWLNDLDKDDSQDGIFYNSLKEPTKYLVPKTWNISGDPTKIVESDFKDYVGMITEREYQIASTDEVSKSKKIYGKQNYLNINSEYMTMTLSGYDSKEIYVRNINEAGDTVFRTQTTAYGNAHSKVTINGISYPPNSTHENNRVSGFNPVNPEGVRPVVNLKKEIKFKEGTSGTKDNPYILDGDKNASTNTYIKNRYPGEYVSFSGYTFRITDTSSGKAKLILNDVLKNSSNKPLTIAFDTRQLNNFDTNPYIQNGRYSPYDEENIAYYLNNTFYNSLSNKSLLTKGYFHNSKIASGGDYRKAITAQEPETKEKNINNRYYYSTFYYDDVYTYIGLPSIGEIFSGNDLYIANYGDTPMLYSTQDDYYISYIIKVLGKNGTSSGSSFATAKGLIRPTLYLNASVKIKSGNGTPNSPYIIE